MNKYQIKYIVNYMSLYSQIYLLMDQYVYNTNFRKQQLINLKLNYHCIKSYIIYLWITVYLLLMLTVRELKFFRVLLLCHFVFMFIL